jgi:hypothetical protein
MRSKVRVTVAVAAVLILCVTGVTINQDTVSGAELTEIIEQIGNKGAVNWSDGYVEAVGIGAPPTQDMGKPQARPMALRAAQVDAYRNLLEVVNGVRVDSTTSVVNFVVESDAVNTQVQGIVKGSKVMRQEYMSDGTVEVTVRMPLTGNFAAVIIPRALNRQKKAPPAMPSPALPAPSTGGYVYTGLVVDARGIQARAAMSPKILDESGQEVYGSLNVDREYAVQQGMSGYARDLTAAQSNPRVTNNPASLKGLRAEGPGRSDIVISNADADKIRSDAENLGFLKKCRVMIVLD